MEYTEINKFATSKATTMSERLKKKKKAAFSAECAMELNLSLMARRRLSSMRVSVSLWGQKCISRSSLN